MTNYTKAVIHIPLDMTYYNDGPLAVEATEQKVFLTGLHGDIERQFVRHDWGDVGPIYVLLANYLNRRELSAWFLYELPWGNDSVAVMTSDDDSMTPLLSYVNGSLRSEQYLDRDPPTDARDGRIVSVLANPTYQQRPTTDH